MESDSSLRLTVTIGASKVTCPVNGGLIDVPGKYQINFKR